MTLTLGQLFEAMDGMSPPLDPLMDSGEDTAAMRVVRSGNAFRSEKNGSFWNDFLSLCNDQEGIAQLLGVRPEAVATWGRKVHKALHDVERHDRQTEEKPDERGELLPTGDNGALVINKRPVGPREEM